MRQICMLVGVVLLGGSAATAGGQDDKGEAYTKFAKGTTWIYETLERRQTGILELEVVAEEEGKILLQARESRQGKSDSATREEAMYVDHGILTWGDVRKNKNRPYVQLYKLGSKKGDTWKTVNKDREEGEATHLGTEEVKVRAGTYKDAVHVRMTVKTDKGDMTYDFYLAPNVGLIKMECEMGSGKSKERSILELREFKPAK